MGPIADRIFVLLLCTSLAAWVVWGWRSWTQHRPPQMTFGSICSLAGLAFASLSAALEIGTGIYAQFIKGFPFFDKVLLRIYALGLLSSLLGLACGLCGVVTKTPLRWKTPALSAVLFLLWFAQAMGE